MTNVEHLLENGLTAADKAFKDDKDCAVAFQEEMNKYYNQMMLNDVAVTQDELWEMVQYIKFVREVDA